VVTNNFLSQTIRLHVNWLTMLPITDTRWVRR